MNKRGLLVAIFGLITLTAAGDESAHRNRPREFRYRQLSKLQKPLQRERTGLCRWELE